MYEYKSVYIYTYVRMYIYICLHAYMYMYTCIYVSVYICICGNMCICAYAYVCICIYTYTNCMYIYVCVHMIHAYMYVYLEGLESSTYACSSCVCMSARMHRCSDNMQGALQVEHPAEVCVCVRRTWTSGLYGICCLSQATIRIYTSHAHFGQQVLFSVFGI